MKKKSILSALLAVLMCLTFFPLNTQARWFATEESHAQALKNLGLFRGVSDTDFDLERPATRVEAVVMLIRLLGCENEALSRHDWHPFTDVPAWANDYIGYAYAEGLSNGISATEFGTGDVSSAMYLTFALRALGYDDSQGDFTWSNPYDLARRLDLIRWNVDLENFLRADIATVSLATLQAPQKDFPLAHLADYLIFKGVFTYDKYYYTLEDIGESVGTMAEYHTLTVNRDGTPIESGYASDWSGDWSSGGSSEWSGSGSSDWSSGGSSDWSSGDTTRDTSGGSTGGTYRPHKNGNPYLGKWYDGIPSYDENGNQIYIVNTNTGKIHVQSCGSVRDIYDENKAVTTDPYGLMDYDSFFTKCGNCKRRW